jgi:putative transposase
VIAFIDEHRSRFGVEPICRVLREHDCGIAPNTYWVAKKRPPSARAERDAELVVEVHRVFEENLFVYGADKMWTQLNREEIRVARCTVERLMRAEGLSGARRGKAFTITTHADDRLHRPADLVARQFRAPAPDRLWVADLTYVKTHSGWVYVAFIIDVYSRMIVGWASLTIVAFGLGDRRVGDGCLEPAASRPGPRPADSSQRQRRSIFVHPLLRAPC